MGTTMNRELSKIARNSALSKSSAPLFLCDMELHLCMFTERLGSYMPPPNHGKSMAGILPDDLPEALSKSPEGVLILPVSLPEIDCHLIALRSDAAGEPCIVCILQTFDPALLCQEKEYLHLARSQIAAAVHDLLNSTASAADRLSFACTQLSRLLNITQLTAADSLVSNMNPHTSTELYPYIRTAVAEFVPKFASVGGSLDIIREKSRIFHCACQPMCFGAVLIPLITAAFCRSADGRVQLAIDDADSTASVSVSIIVPRPACREPIGSFDDLLDSLRMLRLDLLAARDIANHIGVGLDCFMQDDRLIIRMTMAYARPGDITFHAPGRSADTLFLGSLIAQLFELCPLEKA